ncbi:putative transporter [Thozetella sp. PMI_491]|nr:putative transporter [Thozetella sp. PMI_491]
MSTGILTIDIPIIAKDLALPDSLLLWPASVYPLAGSCCLILSGAIADFIGNRVLNLIGCFFLAASTLAVGLSRTGMEIIIFRAIQGTAASMCLPTAFSILTNTIPPGRGRNIGFSCLGVGQPIGFMIGLVLGGFLAETPLTWRFAYYLTAGIIFILFCMSIWKLPQDKPRELFTWRRFATEIDWVGVLIVSTALGMFSYIFAVITANRSNIIRPVNVAILICAIGLFITFGFWMAYMEKCGRKPLIPNSLWRNMAFTTVCIIVMIDWAVLNSLEYFLVLFFQKVQYSSAFQSSLYLLPEVIVGIILSPFIGLIADKVRADHLVFVSTAISTAAPVLMTFANPAWSYWVCTFWAVLTAPPSADIIFTVANVIITNSFSEDTQALAGAVFNTVAQFGNSVGIMIMAVISASVTLESQYPDKSSPEALLLGYRAVFWTCFALMVVATVAGAVGLRRVGKLGA